MSESPGLRNQRLFSVPGAVQHGQHDDKVRVPAPQQAGGVGLGPFRTSVQVSQPRERPHALLLLAPREVRCLFLSFFLRLCVTPMYGILMLYYDACA